MSAATRSIDVVRVVAGARTSVRDAAAAEEPLAIRLHGEAFAVIMRTPGDDRELAAGFLLSERIIRDADDLGTIEYCADADAPENTIHVRLADPRRAADALTHRRAVTSNASCGVCGRQTIESLASQLPTPDGELVVTPAIVARLPERLRESQHAFDATGGLHAAGLFSADGELMDAAEDVGRHNAVDKVIGRALLAERLPLGHAILCVSGRTSFEIVQKAAVAGIPVLAAVSAPSSLAIDLARRCGVTLVGFVRGDAFNVYSGADRIA